MNVHISGKHGVVGVPYDTALANLFPDAPRVTLQGTPMIVLPHNADSYKLLGNMGVEVPAPVLSQYDWNGTNPFEVQKKTVAMLTTNKRAYVLNGMGTGKTRSALLAWHFLREKGEAGKLLVVAPLSTLNFTWRREILEVLKGTTVSIVHHTNRQKRLARLAEDAEIYVTNHDGLAIISEELAKRTDIDTLVIDELAVYRNGQAARTKVVRGVAARMKWAWGMTGSPTPTEPTDAWGQCSVINPARIPRYFARFRDATMTKISQFKYAPKPDALDTVYKAMQPAVRFTLDDVVELPELIERDIEVEMGKDQAKIYKAMEAQAHAFIENGELTAMNAGAVMNKLLQIACGWVYDREGNIHPLDNEKRIEALRDIVLSCDRKVLVFVNFKHALAGISEAITGEGIEHAVVSGDTPISQRNETFSYFQNTDKYKAIIAHPACMSHGLTLTAASTIVWFNPTTSLETFEQANARITRIGQAHKQQVLMLQSSRVEKKLYKGLRAKQKVQDALLSMFEGD
jgi:SNF2 family DNA or RNA helicase